MTFISIIKEQRGYSQAELAEKLGLSLNMVGYMERGVKFASPETLCTLADTLDTKLSSFLMMVQILRKI